MMARFLLVTVLLLSVVTETRSVLAKKQTAQPVAEMPVPISLACWEMTGLDDEIRK